MRILTTLTAIALGCGTLPTALGAQELQPADSVFDAAVARPAFAREKGPIVAIDEAHANFHTMSGRYRPFAELLRNDGFRVRANQAAFSASTLADVQVLVIANALGRFRPGQPVVPAFGDAEEQVLVAWVRGGGRLLFIADHEPMGTAAKRLAARFGVDMSTGRTVDDPHSDWTSGSPSWLVFQRDTGATIGEHPITAGRDSSERVRRVVTFTGQSLGVPTGATALLKLAAGAQDVIEGRGVPAAGRAQAIAMRLGEGRLVVFGEAGLFTAQVASAPGMPPRRFGFTWPGNDDRQLVLNTVRWLAGAIP